MRQTAKVQTKSRRFSLDIQSRWRGCEVRFDRFRIHAPSPPGAALPCASLDLERQARRAAQRRCQLAVAALNLRHQLVEALLAYDSLELGAIAVQRANVVDRDIVDLPGAALALERETQPDRLRALLHDMSARLRVILVGHVSLGDLDLLGRVVLDLVEVGVYEKRGKDRDEPLALIRPQRSPGLAHRQT